MLDSDPQTDRYGVTLRLFNLISVLPRDQQLILLKQLVGDKVTAHLFKLIVEMSEDQQLILLEQMGHHLEFEPPERTVSLEGNEPSMRERTSGPTQRTKPKVPVPPHTPFDARTLTPALASFRWYW